MAIYVGENKAILLKGDRNVAELYKGGTKMFGFSDPVSGEMLTINDAHPVEHKMKCRVRSKNLITPSNFTQGKYSFSTEDIIGENVELSGYTTSGTDLQFDADIKAGETYTLSISVKAPDNGEDISEKTLGFDIYDTDNATWCYTDTNTDTFYRFKYSNTPFDATQFVKYSRTFTAPCNSNKLRLILYWYSRYVILEWGSWQLEKGPTATDYTPCISDLSTVKVQTTGKNLMPIDNYSATIDFGITKEWVSLLNGRYIPIFPNPNSTAYTTIYMKVEEFERNDTTGDITIYLYRKDQLDGTGMPVGSPHTTISLSKIENGEAKTYYSGKVSFSYVGVTKLYPYIRNTNGTKSTITYKNLMICRSSSYDIEEYKGSICNANADGTVSGLTSVSPYMTLTTDTDGVVIDCEYVKN